MNCFRHLKVLVVDHDPIFPILTREFLKLIGFESVSTASDVVQAIDIVTTDRHDVVIVEDEKAYDGLLDVLRRRQHKDCLILTCAFARSDEHVLKPIKGGTDGFIGKPFTPSMLHRSLTAALAGPAGRRLKVVDLSAVRRSNRSVAASSGRGGLAR
ncbi:MAG TPA: response regulator [Lichenihabitans sp.]|jgi:DNA-binding NarL/FixJ family response regulator|nr:response regulator [Lichenihabitans sp.]